LIDFRKHLHFVGGDCNEMKLKAAFRYNRNNIKEQDNYKDVFKWIF
jgi:hypothetical protein